MRRLLLAALILSSACSETSHQAEVGVEDAPCYPNDSCNAGLVCRAGRCRSATSDAGPGDAAPCACVIDGVCVAEGAVHPDNSCQRCAPATSTTAWSVAYNGAPCDDGQACTYGDVCLAGTCKGAPYACDDRLSCTDDVCTGKGPAPDGCAYPVKEGHCLIDGKCRGEGEPSAASRCWGCVSARSTSAWSELCSWRPVPSPTTAELTGISGSGPMRAYVSSANGELLAYDGNAFTIAPTPVGCAALAGVWAGEDGFMIGVGPNGCTIKLENGVWSKVPGTAEHLRAVHGSRASDVYAVGHGEAFRLISGAWWPTPSLVAPKATSRVEIRANLDVYEVEPALPWDVFNPSATSNFSSSVGVYDSLGARHTPTIYFRREAALGLWSFHVVVDGAEITGGTPGVGVEGANGRLTFDTTGRLMTEATFTNDFDFLYATQNQAMLFDFGDAVTTDGGTGLHGVTNYASPSTVTFLSQDGAAGGPVPNTPAWVLPTASIFVANPLDVYVVGKTSTGWHYDALTWTTLAEPAHCNGVWAAAGSGVFAVCEAGRVMQRYGKIWQQLAPATSAADTLTAIWGSSDENIFVVGPNVIRHYDGKRWRTMMSSTGLGLNAVWGTRPEDVFAVGKGGAIWHYAP